MKSRQVNVEITEYTESDGIWYEFSDAGSISVRVTGKSVLISANREGLETLARIALTLAQENVTTGSHVHLEEGFGPRVVEGSNPLIVERVA